ncbi:hypothetical protein VKT23_019898 [Stygiomarasmius scandens]|uniref:Uncharacterized protein n=1 Tax=Marasmiellus scandens TaxID=2682957 RepID=A0ABR1IK67_9AGAR
MTIENGAVADPMEGINSETGDENGGDNELMDGNERREVEGVGDSNEEASTTASVLVVSEYAGERGNWPPWLNSSFEVLGSTDGLKDKDGWKEVLMDWVELEQKYSFENPSGPAAFYTKVGRPALVDWWS